MRWLRKSIIEPVEPSPVHGDGGYPQDVVGAHALVRQWSFKVKRCSVPDYLRIPVSMQQITTLPQLIENLVQDFVQGLILIDVNVILGFAVDGVKIHLVFRHISSRSAAWWALSAYKGVMSLAIHP